MHFRESKSAIFNFAIFLNGNQLLKVRICWPQSTFVPLSVTMAQMAHFSFPYYFIIPNSEFRIPKFVVQISEFGIQNSEFEIVK